MDSALAPGRAAIKVSGRAGDSMAKAEPKTKATKASVSAFLDAVDNEQRRKDAKAVLKIMKEITGEKAVMWGPSIIGFGTYQSRSGPWPITGFSPRKANLVLYVMAGFDGYGALMKKLGKHKTGKSCLYLNKLSDVDEAVLREVVGRSVAWMREKYAC